MERAVATAIVFGLRKPLSETRRRARLPAGAADGAVVRANDLGRIAFDNQRALETAGIGRDNPVFDADDGQSSIPLDCMNSIGSRAFFEMLHGWHKYCKLLGQFEPPDASATIWSS
jgi:hypothetical protein